MSYRGSNYYPPEGHDWVATNEIRRLADHNEAQLQEAHTHRVAAFRAQFLDLLERHGAVNDGYGWALFVDEAEGDTASADDKQVLIYSGVMEKDVVGAKLLPTLRILTSERFETESGSAYLAEDVCLLPNDISRYFMSGVLFPDRSAKTFGAVMEKSTTPLFSVSPEGVLTTTRNVTGRTPLRSIWTKKTSHIGAPKPFGNGRPVLVDMEYALAKGEGFLAQIGELEPDFQYVDRPEAE